MYYLSGMVPVTRVLAELSRYDFKTEKTNQKNELSSSYLKFLQKLQPSNTVPQMGGNYLCVDRDRINDLCKKYLQDTALTDLETDFIETPTASMHLALAKIEEGIAWLKTHDTALHDILTLVIHTFFYFRSKESGGGSVSSAIGVIWCGNRKNWVLNDVVEFLVHELTHNLVFLDEYRYKHYTNLDTLIAKENYAQSAILKIGRPLDKVFHSLVVAHEVLQFRLKFGEPNNPAIHPASVVIKKNCFDTIESVRKLVTKKSDLVTARFVEVLNMVEESLLQMQEIKISGAA